MPSSIYMYSLLLHKGGPKTNPCNILWISSITWTLPTPHLINIDWYRTYTPLTVVDSAIWLANGFVLTTSTQALLLLRKTALVQTILLFPPFIAHMFQNGKLNWDNLIASVLIHLRCFVRAQLFVCQHFPGSVVKHNFLSLNLAYCGEKSNQGRLVNWHFLNSIAWSDWLLPSLMNMSLILFYHSVERIDQIWLCSIY
jgi:hypothetical protein